MGRIIAVANQKGGVGKTTTSINLAACLAEKGKKVLAVDMDPQGNLTSGLGVDKDSVEKSIYELIIGEVDIKEVINKEVLENLDIIPTSIDLSAAEIELIGVDDKEYILRNAIDQVKDQYDFVIIDCPPSLSMLTINAMTTADSVIVPIQCEYYALEGLSQLIHTVELVKDRLNSKLEIEGVVFLANPDMLSGLTTWAFYDNNAADCVVSTFGSGCSAVVTQATIENRKGGKRTFLGFFDPSVRPHFEADKLSYTIPMSRFKEMYETMRQSCLFDTHAWGKIKERMNG